MAKEEKKKAKKPAAEETPAAGLQDGAAPESGEGAGAEGGAAQDGSGGDAADEAPAQEPDWKDMYARTLADFDNYRKRVSRDREELVKFAAAETVKDVIPVADNLSLAIDQAKGKEEDPFVKGVILAYQGLLKALKDHGAEPFDSIGAEPDPNLHEAVATLPSETVGEGRISNEIKKGWMLNGRLLRAAQVVVSSGKAG